MPVKISNPSFTDRLEAALAAIRAGGSMSAKEAELLDLASYAEEIKGWANELDTKIADFEAEVELYYGATDKAERREVHKRLLDAGDEAAGALRAIEGYLTPEVEVTKTMAADRSVRT
jgi:hypothetical protein